MPTRKKAPPAAVKKNATGKTAKVPGKKSDGDKEKPFYIVCVGASAGGLTAIIELVAQFEPTLHAAVFIVLHLSKTALGDILLDRLRRNTKLACKLAEDNEEILPGHIYLARPDTHLLVKKDTVIVGRGPAENRFRPSIDVLFRSAAANYGERAVGVILTGLLNDGTVGMMAIKESGGTCIVQDPNEAEYPDMPFSALQAVEVNFVAPLRKMGATIGSVIKHHRIKGIEPPQKVIVESRISEKSATGIEHVQALGEKSIFACPDCGGGLWRIKNGKLAHYRCHIGHSYSEDDLLVKQAESIEHTIWVAVRMMEERRINFTKMEKQHLDKGLDKLAGSYGQHALQLEAHISRLKELLFAVQKD